MAIMAPQLLFAAAVTVLLIFISIFIVRRLQIPPAQTLQTTKSSPSELTMLGKRLSAALPDNVVLSHDTTAFKRAVNAYWAKQETEVVPACVVQPTDAQQLCTAVNILKGEYDERRKRADQEQAEGLFAVRGGGHSPVPNAASIKGGVLIDLGLICEVTPSEDGSSVVIGAGAKWIDVSKVLDAKGLAVVGGRNSQVGVSGLTLGGKDLFSRL